MPYQTATNPETGERVVLIGNQWVPFTQSATNEQGQKAFLIGNEWQTPDQGMIPGAPTPAPVAPTEQPEAAPAAQAPQPTPFAGDQTAAAMSAYGFGDSFKGLGTTIAEQIKQIGYGYVLNRADEAAKLFEGAEGDSRQKLNAVTNEYIEKLKQSDERVKAATPRDLNMLEQGIRSAIESLAVAVPGLAASFVTKSPYPAVAAAGLQTKFGSYAQARQEGLNPQQAELYANVDGALEAATEFLPTEFLMKSFGAKSLKGVKQELVKFALGEGLGEQVATATQSLNAYVNGLDKELEQAKTWQEAAEIQAKRQAVTALATIVTGGVFAGGAAAVGKYQERAAAKQAEEYRRVADVARTYREGQAGREAPELGPRPEEIPTGEEFPPIVEPVTEPAAPEPEGITPVVPEGVSSLEDLLGFTPTKRAKAVEDEEGPPPYTEDEIPAFVRGEGEAAPAAKKEEAKVEEPAPAEGMVRVYHSGSRGEGETGRWASTDKTYAENYRKDLPLFYTDIPADDPRLQGAWADQGVSQGFTFNFELTPKEAAQLKPAQKEVTPAAEKVTAPETKLPDPAQLTLPITETPPAEALVQRSAFKAPETEAPSGTTEPSAGETVGGAGVRGTELPVSRPTPEGQGAAEPAGAGVGVPVSDTARVDERAEAVKPALTDDLTNSANQSGRGFSRLEDSFDRHFYNYPKNRWGKASGSAKDVPKSIKANARPVLTKFLQSVTGSQKKTLPALINDLHSILDSKQKEAVALLDRIDPNKKEPRPEIGVELGKSIQDFSNIRKAINETAMAWYYASAVADKIKTEQEQTAQKTAPAPNTDLFSIAPQDVVNMWADPAFAPRAPGFKPRVRQIVDQARNGVISAEQAVTQISKLAETPETRERAPLVRDVAHFKARLTQALRQGRINQATHDLTQWLISKNPKLIEGLGLSISTRDPSGRRIPLGVQGLYSVVQDIVTLVPRANSDVTLVHEILHRAERMMPADIQDQICKIWERQLFANLRTAEMRGTEFEKDFYNRLVEYHFGEGGQRKLPEDLEALQDLIKTGAVPAESYQFMNPSEFWAVNASRIMQNRFKASPTFVARVKQWLKEFVERIKGIMDLPSDAPFLRAMDKVMKGKGEFISATLHANNRMYNIERKTRYKGWKSPEREYRDGEELILKRANRNREIQKPPSPNQVIKESLTKKAYEDFADNAQSILRPWKRERQRLENEGKLIISGPNANDVYSPLAQANGVARWYTNMYVIPAQQNLYSAIAEYGRDKGIPPEDALEFFAQMRQAMSADLRRDELYRRYKPLKTEAVYQLSNGKKMAPAAVRVQLYRKAAEILGNQTIPQAQKYKMLDDIRAHLNAIVSNPAYEDPLGHSMHPNRPVDSSNNNLEMSTNWDASFYSPAEGNDPILHTAPTLRVMEEDLKQYPSLRKAMDEFNKLQDITKNLKRVAGVWNEYMDDVSHFYGWGDGYSPLMMEKEGDPLNLEGTRNSGDVATFVPGMQGGNHRVANVVYQSIANAYRAASIAARGPITQRVANLIDTKQIPGQHMIDISPAEQFMLALENQPVPTDVMGGNVIINTLPDGTKQVYRMDDTTERGKKLLDGVRRVNEQLPKGFEIAGKVMGVIAGQFTRLRAPFAPAQFVMDSMTLAPMISADYGLRFGPQFLAQATANLATLKGPKLSKLLRLYQSGNETALREYTKDDPFLTDVVDYLQQGGPSAYGQAYKIERGLTDYVEKIKRNPFVTASESFGELIDNWTDSWDLLSRVSAMGVLKRRELEKMGYAKVVEEKGKNSPEAKKIMDAAVTRAVSQAKELANFNLHGNLTARKIASLYMFWRPNITTAIATADMIGKGFEDPQARITRELSPEAQTNQQLVDEKLKEFGRQRIRVRAIITIMIGAGMALYELARAMSDYDEEGRNKVAIGDKGQWIRAAQFRIPGTDWNYNAMFGFGPGGFMAFGAQLSALLHGDQTVKEFSRNVFDTVASMFSPITPSQISMTDNFLAWFGTTFAPSLAKPGIEYLANRTSVDTAIYNAHPSRFSDIYSGGKNVPDLYKSLSNLIWDLTGNEVAPNKLYFFATHYAQAVNDIVVTGFDIGSMLLGNKTPEDVNWKPIVGSFVSRTGNADSREYYNLQPRIEAAQHRVSEIEIKGRKARENLEPDDLRILEAYKKTYSRIQELNGVRNALNRAQLPPDQKKRRLEAVETELNRLMRITVDDIKQVQLTKQASKP